MPRFFRLMPIALAAFPLLSGCSAEPALREQGIPALTHAWSASPRLPARGETPPVAAFEQACEAGEFGLAARLWPALEPLSPSLGASRIIRLRALSALVSGDRNPLPAAPRR